MKGGGESREKLWRDYCLQRLSNGTRCAWDGSPPWGGRRVGTSKRSAYGKSEREKRKLSRAGSVVASRPEAGVETLREDGRKGNPRLKRGNGASALRGEKTAGGEGAYDARRRAELYLEGKTLAAKVKIRQAIRKL